MSNEMTKFTGSPPAEIKSSRDLTSAADRFPPPTPLKKISFEERLLRICIGFLPSTYHQLDQKVLPFCHPSITATPFSWLRRSRTTLQLTARAVAERAGVHLTTYVQIEKSEVDGSITIESMRQFAEAMDCEFVYAIRPKNQLSFTARIWKPIREDAEKKINQRQYLDEDSRYRVLGQMMGRFFQIPKLRRKYGWSERFPRRY